MSVFPKTRAAALSGLLRDLLLAVRDLAGPAWLGASSDDPDVAAFTVLQAAGPPDPARTDEACAQVLWARFAPPAGQDDPSPVPPASPPASPPARPPAARTRTPRPAPPTHIPHRSARRGPPGQTDGPGRDKKFRRAGWQPAGSASP